MKYSQIVPAVIPQNQEELQVMSEILRFSREFHLDVTDGIFVPKSSWPYDPLGDPVSIKSSLDFYTLEVDLMVQKPIEAAAKWIIAGADMLVFHVETLSLEAFKNFTDHTIVSVGVSFHGMTPIDKLLEYAQYADYVQVMGIYEIGSQGQPLDRAVFDKISIIKKRFPNMSVTIDGSVNSLTIKSLKLAGADRFICGSAIVKQDDPELAHQELVKLIND